MTEEEYFRKNYPDSCYGGRPLSPHWDFFQDGVEFGERQSEKRIAELEAQIEKMKCGGNCKFEYWKNTGGCYDQKCRFTGLDCTNCKDKWKGKWENE